MWKAIPIKVIYTLVSAGLLHHSLIWGVPWNRVTCCLWKGLSDLQTVSDPVGLSRIRMRVPKSLWIKACLSAGAWGWRGAQGLSLQVPGYLWDRIFWKFYNSLYWPVPRCQTESRSFRLDLATVGGRWVPSFKMLFTWPVCKVEGEGWKGGWSKQGERDLLLWRCRAVGKTSIVKVWGRVGEFDYGVSVFPIEHAEII